MGINRPALHPPPHYRQQSDSTRVKTGLPAHPLRNRGELCGFNFNRMTTVIQYIALSFVFMVLAGLGGFLYYHFSVTYPLKKVI